MPHCLLVIVIAVYLENESSFNTKKRQRYRFFEEIGVEWREQIERERERGRTGRVYTERKAIANQLSLSLFLFVLLLFFLPRLSRPITWPSNIN
jgi:hypothetical protein